MKATLLFFCISLCSFYSKAQQDSSNLKLLDSLRQFIRMDVGLPVGNDFYSVWDDQQGLLSYVYISSADTIAATDSNGVFLFCGKDSLKADSICAVNTLKGYHVMHYRTAGNSAAKLNTHLVNYPPEAFVFIIIHEAVHVYLHDSAIVIPYVMEEALCDVIGNYYAEQFLGNDPNALKQRKYNEKICATVNKAEAALSSHPGRAEKIYRQTEKKIYTITEKGNEFQQKRYRYPFNNAYLLRNRAYCHYYFELKDWFLSEGLFLLINYLRTQEIKY